MVKTLTCALTIVLVIVILGFLKQRLRGPRQIFDDESEPERAPVWECPNGTMTEWTHLLRTIKHMTHRKIPPKTVIFVSHNYKNLPPYAKLAIAAYRNYARKFDNIEFLELRHDAAESAISPYWLRVCDFQRLSMRYPEGTIIGYMDLDTMIRPEFSNVPIHRVLAAIDGCTRWSWQIYVGCCPFQNDDNYLNSGVIFARITPWTKAFFKTWLSRYPAESWVKHPRTHKWLCRKNGKTPCSWAAEAYEQGVLNKLWAEDTLDITQHLCRVHRTVFSEIDLDRPSFMIHLMRGGDEYRERVFKNFLSQH